MIKMADFRVKQKDEKLERNILNLMLFSEDAIDIIIDKEITWEDFSDEYHQQVFEELIDIYSDDKIGGVAIGKDLSPLLKRMREAFDDERQIMSRISAIKNADVDIKFLNIWLDELISYTKIRRIISAIRKPMAYLRDNADNVDSDKLIRIFTDSYQDALADVTSDAKSITTAELTNKVLRDIIEDIETPSAISFGLEGLDDACKLLRGYLTYIAGDTGIGKTTVATYLAGTVAKSGAKVLFINLETDYKDCMKKLISSCVEINSHRVRYSHLINPSKMLTDDDMALLSELADSNPLSEFGIYWIYKPGMTVEELHREVVRHVRMYDIDVVIGDYYQLLGIEGSDDYDSFVIPKVSKRLMNIAGQAYINPQGKQKKLVHVWLSQVNKEVMYRADKHPTKDDLYYGGTRDARLVLGIYRDEYYNPEETEKPGIIELGILKQNNGIAGSWFDYVFDSQYQSIRNMTDDEKDLMNGDDDYDEDDE